MGFEVGQRIADYEIEGLLGVGGMGRVYRVRNVISHRTEAIKVLLADLTAEPDLAARFLSEIRTLAGLDHPNIAQLRTALQTGNELVMVMEFVDGSTLQELAQDEPLPTELVVSYMHQVLTALSYAHSRGVVHRDIKPANIMVTPNGLVKLTDFGIAKSKSKDELTRPGTTVGSLNYMSPEQALGGNAADGRSDIYSIGITLYELLAGRRPFEDESAYVILHSQLNVVPTPPMEINPILSRPLSNLIMKALEKDPDKRFQSAAAMSEALRLATGIPAEDVSESANHFVPDAVADAMSWFSTGEHRRLWLAAEVFAGLAIAAGAVVGVPHLLKPAIAAKPALHAGPQLPPEHVVSPAVAAIPTPTPLPPVVAAAPLHATVTAVNFVKAAIAAIPKQRKDEQRATLLLPVKARSPEPEPAPEVESKPIFNTATLAELEEIRQQRAALSARANAVSASVRRLRTAEAAAGDVLNDDVAGAYVDMNMNLSAEKADLEGGDVAAARGHLEKAANQVSLLEKLLSERAN